MMTIGKPAQVLKPWQLYKAWPILDKRSFLAWVPERNHPSFRQAFAAFLIGDGENRLGTRGLPPFYALTSAMPKAARKQMLIELGRLHIAGQVAYLNAKLCALPPNANPRRLLRALNCVSVRTSERETKVRKLGYSVLDVPTEVSLGWVERVYETWHKPPHTKLAKELASAEGGSGVHSNFLSRFPKLRSPYGSVGDVALMLRSAKMPLSSDESESLKRLWDACDYKAVRALRERVFNRSLLGLLIRARNHDQKSFGEFVHILIAEQIEWRVHEGRFARGGELSQGCIDLGLMAGLSHDEIVFLLESLVGTSLTKSGSTTAMTQLCSLFVREPVGLLEWLEGFLLQQSQLRSDERHHSLKQFALAWGALTRHLNQFNGGPSIDQLCDMVSDLGPTPITTDAQTRRLQREGLKLRRRSTKG